MLLPCWLYHCYCFYHDVAAVGVFHSAFCVKLLIFFIVFFLGVIIFHYLDILGVIYTINYLVHRQQDDTKVLCPKFVGGLGNQMFQYASLYGIAKSKNMTLLIDAECELNQLFSISAVTLPHVACWFLKTRTDYRPCAFNKDTMNFSADQNYQMQGYLQSWQYFHRAEPALRQIFKFKAAIREKAESILKQAIEVHQKQVRNQALTFIAIHIRRGDITKDNFKTYGYNTASLDYIRRAMQYFSERYHRILFLVCTNDMEWAKRYLHKKNVYFVENQPREVDMALMASCNHTIMTVGSFGWWSAWLANGEVVYYRYPASRGSKLRKAFSKEMTDYYYPKWKPML
ncbi:galactoside alpha-(1,2)-fucosyltransferase 2 isoform X2 [Octopus bimaculoides]|uniref:L-Fucosyltransferase n=1 Tax=Octopus bimaculoides TaxID=37653 RepID=A0A0L8GMH7_OCTBM|nr:galactoside alpha-(1,2)-fucosyltransferase 2 isoform X2 [Octopus bimaculoides]XP_052832072.1 galactoside alpha-(1,2)-fucosyltransferase 2 isoform X2 [Octopus bimaculoides]|eukprot:XP_014779627.1 PREDICTED: galactoside 2-alpha-L-fucosyltransferase 2-like isoform X2 [Octopus bimaculoides]